MSPAELRSILTSTQTNAATRTSIMRQLKDSAPVKVSVPGTADPSPLEERFLKLWKELDGPAIEREFFFSGRKFRMDFVHLPSMIAVEIDGATCAGVRGGHTSKTGYQAGCVKSNLAIALGYRMFRLTATMITAEHVRPIVALCKKG